MAGSGQRKGHCGSWNNRSGCNRRGGLGAKIERTTKKVTRVRTLTAEMRIFIATKCRRFMAFFMAKRPIPLERKDSAVSISRAYAAKTPRFWTFPILSRRCLRTGYRLNVEGDQRLVCSWRSRLTSLNALQRRMALLVL